MRINKYLSAAGFCSRRAADKLVEEGRVSVRGRIIKTGEQISEEDEVFVDDQRVIFENEKILIAFNKPAGIVTTSGHYRDNIIDYINYPKRIYPIGRLDKESTGLILLTNRGELVNSLLKASNYHEKEYIVDVNRDVSAAFLKAMSSGVPILDTVTRPCEIKKLGKRRFSIILTQGLNRQIRRMCEYYDYRVRSLKRVRVLNILLGDLPEGQYRHITGEELNNLEKLLGQNNE